MSIIPKYGLLQFRNSARIYIKDIEESLQLFKEETKHTKVSLFLAHKPDDRETLDSAINFLKGFGVQIYVDWMDGEVPKDTSDEATKHIQQKIKESTKFVFLATEEALDSKWCKWAIRYANTQKSTENIAILPIRDDYTDYNGTEYLQKYPYIQESESIKEAYDVKYPSGETKELGDWLAS